MLNPEKLRLTSKGGEKMRTEKNITNKTENYVLVPAADIYETDENYTLKIEMPGISKEDLNIILNDNELEIKGHSAEDEPAEMELKYSEYHAHDYYRKFKIGNGIDKNEIRASLTDGTLTLILQKNEEVKPKKIEINSVQ